jgi:hypothetical protein
MDETAAAFHPVEVGENARDLSVFRGANAFLWHGRVVRSMYENRHD